MKMEIVFNKIFVTLFYIVLLLCLQLIQKFKAFVNACASVSESYFIKRTWRYPHHLIITHQRCL